MRRLVLPLASVALVVLLASGSAIAAEPYGTLDANTLGAESNWYSYHVGTETGQTFVAKHSGQLSSVQLKLYDAVPEWEPYGGWIVRLYSISDPFEQELSFRGLLSSGKIPLSDLEQVTATPTMVTADLSGMVQAGHHYAITVEATTESPWRWVAHHNGYDPSTDIYPDGMGLQNGSSSGWEVRRDYGIDTIFAVYVNRRPTVSDPTPAPGSTVGAHRPIVAATVKDPETDLRRSNISLFVDGKRIARTSFAYDSSTDRLSYRPATRLPSGEHAVEVVATDERGLAKTKRWSFTIG